MKKTILTVFITLVIVFALGGSRPRYSPSWTLSHTAVYGIDMNDATITTAEIRGQNGETIDNVTDGNWGIGDAELVHHTNVVYALKTVISTIDVDDDASTDDFSFDDDAGDQNEQSVDLGTLIPAFAEIVSVQLRCLETVTSNAAMSIDLGLATGDADYLAAANIDTINDLDGTATGNAPKLEASGSARNVWINATPDANWDSLDAGRWAVMVTYIDYTGVVDAQG